ncbi:oxidoreductase [Lysinibacillus sp. NPDC098008]|uniref:oxidoreductase n=1 Tax=Lysinibacillus sp. NPDC098008 TaxID=3364146 RepID=UPI003812F819
MEVGMRAAIVVGATGLTGTALVEQLCENDEYVSVTAIVRTKPAFTHPKLEVKIRDFERLEEQDIEFAHELYCCLGTTIKKAGSREIFEKVDFEYPLAIASLAKKRGIPHFLVITSMGANEHSPFYYNRVKGKLEQDLIELGLQRLSIIRPSLLVGQRQEFRLGEKVGEKILKLAKPFLVGPFKAARAIEASQVAKAMIVIALYGKHQPVTIYKSPELTALDYPEIPEEDTSRETLFNWDKHKLADTVVDKEVHFHRQDQEQK